MTAENHLVVKLDGFPGPSQILQRRRRRKELRSPFHDLPLLIRHVEEQRRVRIAEIELHDGSAHGNRLVHFVRDGSTVVGKGRTGKRHDGQDSENRTQIPSHSFLLEKCNRATRHTDAEPKQKRQSAHGASEPGIEAALVGIGDDAKRGEVENQRDG